MIYFTAHTFKCVCHCRRAMFRVLGMYNFACYPTSYSRYSHASLFALKYAYSQICFKLMNLHNCPKTMWAFSLKCKKLMVQQPYILNFIILLPYFFYIFCFHNLNNLYLNRCQESVQVKVTFKPENLLLNKVISKGLFHVIVLTKKTQKKLRISVLVD
jgi:hypothetical protein